MKSPCKECLVKPNCSEICIQYAEWIYESGEYRKIGPVAIKKVESESREDAIHYIFAAELIYKYLQKL